MAERRMTLGAQVEQKKCGLWSHSDLKVDPSFASNLLCGPEQVASSLSLNLLICKHLL